MKNITLFFLFMSFTPGLFAQESGEILKHRENVRSGSGPDHWHTTLAEAKELAVKMIRGTARDQLYLERMTGYSVSEDAKDFLLRNHEDWQELVGNLTFGIVDSTQELNWYFFNTYSRSERISIDWVWGPVSFAPDFLSPQPRLLANRPLPLLSQEGLASDLLFYSLFLLADRQTGERLLDVNDYKFIEEIAWLARMRNKFDRRHLAKPDFFEKDPNFQRNRQLPPMASIKSPELRAKRNRESFAQGIQVIGQPLAPGAVRITSVALDERRQPVRKSFSYDSTESARFIYGNLNEDIELPKPGMYQIEYGKVHLGSFIPQTNLYVRVKSSSFVVIPLMEITVPEFDQNDIKGVYVVRDFSSKLEQEKALIRAWIWKYWKTDRLCSEENRRNQFILAPDYDADLCKAVEGIYEMTDLLDVLLRFDEGAGELYRRNTHYAYQLNALSFSAITGSLESISKGGDAKNPEPHSLPKKWLSVHDEKYRDGHGIARSQFDAPDFRDVRVPSQTSEGLSYDLLFPGDKAWALPGDYAFEFHYKSSTPGDATSGIVRKTLGAVRSQLKPLFLDREPTLERSTSHVTPESPLNIPITMEDFVKYNQSLAAADSNSETDLQHQYTHSSNKLKPSRSAPRIRRTETFLGKSSSRLNASYALDEAKQDATYKCTQNGFASSECHYVSSSCKSSGLLFIKCTALVEGRSST